MAHRVMKTERERERDRLHLENWQQIDKCNIFLYSFVFTLYKWLMIYSVLAHEKTNILRLNRKSLFFAQ